MKTNTRIKIKNIKSLAMGPDGRPWSGTIYFDGKRVGTVVDQAYGGEYDISVPDDIKKAMTDYVATLLDEADDEYMGEIDSYLGHFADEAEHETKLRRLCKSKTLFRLKSDESDDWSYFPVKFCSKIVKHIYDKYGKNEVEILNERFAS